MESERSRVGNALAHLERLGIVKELTQRRLGRIFSYARYADILNEGLAPLDGGRRKPVK